MRIVFWGNSLFSLKPLEVLARHFDICAVVTAPDTFVGRGMKSVRINPIKEYALSQKIPLLQPEKVKNNPILLEELSTLNADLFVLVSYGKMIPPSIFSFPPHGMINLHASLLPKLRGASPIQFALWQGLEETGCTVQYIVQGMDEGDILAQRTVPIAPEDDYFSLEDKLSQDGAQLLLYTVQAMAAAKIKAMHQNNDEASYCSLITKEDGAVDFTMTAEEIIRAWKALKHFPGIYLPLEMGHLKILSCGIGQGKGKKGEILEISSKGLLIAVHESALLLQQVQSSGKKQCSARDFANGIRLKKGDILK